MLSLGPLRTSWLGNRVRTSSLFFAEGTKDENHLSRRGSDLCHTRLERYDGLSQPFSHWTLKAAGDVTLASTSVSFNRSGHRAQESCFYSTYFSLRLEATLLILACWLLVTFSSYWPLDHRNMVLVYWGSKHFSCQTWRNKLSFKIAVRLLLTFTSKMHLSLTCPRSKGIGFWVVVTYFLLTAISCIHESKWHFS